MGKNAFGSRASGGGLKPDAPPVFGLLSNYTSANEQGATIGVAQSAGSLARILDRYLRRRFTCIFHRCRI